MRVRHLSIVAASGLVVASIISTAVLASPPLQGGPICEGQTDVPIYGWIPFEFRCVNHSCS